MPAPILPPIGPDLRQWARQFTQYFSKNAAKVYHKSSDDNPSDDGVLLWDAANKYAVISQNNAFRQVPHKSAVPASNVGAAGDVAGLLSWDANYIYVCTGSYDGSTAIWKRAALSAW